MSDADDVINFDDFVGLVEPPDWARRSMEDYAPPWRWTRDGNRSPLDSLLAPVNLRVLRVLWSHSYPVYWPATIARLSGLSRSAVHRSLGILVEWQVVEKFPAYDGRPGSFCYRLRRKDTIVVLLDRLFEMEARIYLESVAPKKRPTAPRPEGHGPP